MYSFNFYCVILWAHSMLGAGEMQTPKELAPLHLFSCVMSPPRCGNWGHNGGQSLPSASLESCRANRQATVSRQDFPGGPSLKNQPCSSGHGLDPWVGTIPHAVRQLLSWGSRACTLR